MNANRQLPKRAAVLGCLLPLLLMIAGAMWVLFVVVPVPPWSDLKVASTEKARAGAPILAAIYRFRDSTGLFPTRIEDLAAELPQAGALRDWHIEWMPYVWYLSTRARAGDLDFEVRFCSRHAAGQAPCWECLIGRHDYSLDVAVELPSSAHRASTAPSSATLAEFDRRVRSTDLVTDAQDLQWHYQGLVSYLLRRRLYAAAVARCLEMRERQIAPWWSEQVLAFTRLQLGDRAMAQEELQRWVEQHPGFTTFTFLAAFHRRARDTREALQALREAARFDLDHTESNFTPDAYAFDAAAFACSEGEFALAVSLCDLWELGGNERSCLTIRAAAKLALGDFEAAAMDAKAAAPSQGILRFDPGASLLQAIEARDQSWRATLPDSMVELVVEYS